MAKTKHTSGPYYLAMQIPGGQCLICADGPKGRQELATVHSEGRYGPKTYPVKANAALFCAAPEMLRILKQIHASLLNDPRSRASDIDQIAEVLEAAEGEES